MAKKTNRLGEGCRHGILCLTTGKDNASVLVELKDYYSKEVKERKTFTESREFYAFVSTASSVGIATDSEKWMEEKGTVLPLDCGW